MLQGMRQHGGRRGVLLQLGKLSESLAASESRIAQKERKTPNNANPKPYICIPGTWYRNRVWGIPQERRAFIMRVEGWFITPRSVHEGRDRL